MSTKRVTQEFYCGECKGYFRVRLSTGLDEYEVLIRCPNPKCRHEHQRRIYKGEIKEDGRFGTPVKETICPTMATYSKQPSTEKMIIAHKNGSYGGRRDGVVIENDGRVRRVPMDPANVRVALDERWTELADREQGRV